MLLPAQGAHEACDRWAALGNPVGVQKSLLSGYKSNSVNWLGKGVSEFGANLVR